MFSPNLNDELTETLWSLFRNEPTQLAKITSKLKYTPDVCVYILKNALYNIREFNTPEHVERVFACLPILLSNGFKFPPASYTIVMEDVSPEQTKRMCDILACHDLNPNAIDKTQFIKYSAICQAVRNNNTIGVEILIKMGVVPDYSALWNAARWGYFELLKCLCEAQVNDDYKTSIKGKRESLISASLGVFECNKEQCKCLKYLLDIGCTSSRVDSAPPIYTAAKFGYTSAVRIFLDAGIDVNTRNGFKTPLDVASKYGNRHVVALLLKKGAKISGDTMFNVVCTAKNGNTTEKFKCFMLLVKNERFTDELRSDTISSLKICERGKKWYKILDIPEKKLIN